MSSAPVSANSLSDCPFGGNPKVAAQMGFPSCGIARPGPFFSSLNLGKQGGGRRSRRRGHKSRKGGRKSRRGGTKSHRNRAKSRRGGRKSYKLGPLHLQGGRK